MSMSLPKGCLLHGMHWCTYRRGRGLIEQETANKAYQAFIEP
jgi:hypothetical protein